MASLLDVVATALTRFVDELRLECPTHVGIRSAINLSSRRLETHSAAVTAPEEVAARAHLPSRRLGSRSFGGAVLAQTLDGGWSPATTQPPGHR